MIRTDKLALWVITNPNSDSNNINDDGNTSISSKSQYQLISTSHCDNNANGKEVTQFNLTYIEIAFLLLNTTSYLQSLDAEVIKSFKVHYK
ncbi:hypothetical protein RCL_jg24853.t1 [Rhizophagus clarus]|uniref:Uncharacterized protein n=1 Tax=Rhizophagus clarus TaxID=94130 RepID=A0A8H3LVU1_9GLOM|nr:hypothetical protein RCL_jg24853.t1 [Rhizophagus clarus]